MTHRPKHSQLTQLPNIGPKTAAYLEQLGVGSVDQFLQADPYYLFDRIVTELNPAFSVNGLAALVGAQASLPWHKLTHQVKAKYEEWLWSQPVARDYSYGIIPWAQLDDDWVVLVIQHQEGHWAFPKGHKEVGEDDLAAAQRELTEETGLPVLRFFSESYVLEEYSFFKNRQRFAKQVRYWLAEVPYQPITVQPEEVVSFKWLPPAEVAAQLSFGATQQTWHIAQEMFNHRLV